MVEGKYFVVTHKVGYEMVTRVFKTENEAEIINFSINGEDDMPIVFMKDISKETFDAVDTINKVNLIPFDDDKLE